MHQQHHNNNSKTKTILLIMLAVMLPYLIKHSLTEPNIKTHVRKLALPKQKQKQKSVQQVKRPKPEAPWHTIITQKGDTLTKIFKRVGLTTNALHDLLKQTSYKKQLQRISPNQKIKLQVNHKTLQSLIFPLTKTKQLVINQKEKHYQSKIIEVKRHKHQHYIMATIDHSLYKTALEKHIPHKIIQQLSRIFAWKIDFEKDIRRGDRFLIIFNSYYIDDKPSTTGDIIAASFTNRGTTYYAFKHVDHAGSTDYFDQDGKSLIQQFNRFPVNYSHVSSTYSLHRLHPVLHYRRMHKGIDLAAPIGTPIRAVSAGKIVKIGKNHGYGNMIKLKHSKKYVTVYAHMLRFKRGLSLGSRVHRGQVIGYVGQTGLATGPHCHFEFHIFNRPVNPATVNLPRGNPLVRQALKAFQTKARPLIAQIKLFQQANLASKKG